MKLKLSIKFIYLLLLIPAVSFGLAKAISLGDVTNNPNSAIFLLKFTNDSLISPSEETSEAYVNQLKTGKHCYQGELISSYFNHVPNNPKVCFFGAGPGRNQAVPELNNYSPAVLKEKGLVNFDSPSVYYLAITSQETSYPISLYNSVLAIECPNGYGNNEPCFPHPNASAHSSLIDEIYKICPVSKGFFSICDSVEFCPC